MFIDVQGAGVVGVDLKLRSSVALSCYAGRCTDPCCGRVRTRRPKYDVLFVLKVFV